MKLIMHIMLSSKNIGIPALHISLSRIDYLKSFAETCVSVFPSDFPVILLLLSWLILSQVKNISHRNGSSWWRQGSHGRQAPTGTAMHVTARRCTAVLGCGDAHSPTTVWSSWFAPSLSFILGFSQFFHWIHINSDSCLNNSIVLLFINLCVNIIYSNCL